MLKSIAYTGLAEVSISDAMGRTLYSNRLTLQKGDQLPVNIPKKNQFIVVHIGINGDYTSEKIFY